jgi:predicted amidophosphoribosyltransferase
MFKGVLRRLFGISDPKKTPVERLNPRLSPVPLPGPFDYAVGLGEYSRIDFHDRTDMGTLVHLMKNSHLRKAADRLIELVIDYLLEYPLPENPDLIITIPDSTSNRPFSPTIYIAKQLGSRFGWPVGNNVILRTRLEKPQRDRSFEERLEDARPRYEINIGVDIRDRHILLFDDIYASGQSLIEAGHLIREHNPKSLMALTLVRLRNT